MLQRITAEEEEAFWLGLDAEIVGAGASAGATGSTLTALGGGANRDGRWH